jgi:hypothetical protein
LSTGYIITDDLDDDGAQAEEIRLDALAAPTADILGDDFEKVLFLNARRAPRALKLVGHSGP